MTHMPDPQTLLAPPPSDFSLANLRAVVLRDEALPERRRALMASAINTAGRALRRPIETIPADPVRLRPLLDPVTPAMARLTAGSWSNVRSMLAAALARVTPGFLPQRFDLAPSPVWQALLDRVRPDRDALFLLGRFGRWATQLGIEPEAVDDAVLERYREALVHRSLTSEPAKILRKTIRVWNAALARSEDGEAAPLALPNSKARYSLPWDTYPPSLLTEIERWLDRLGRDPFADRDFRALRPASIRSRHKYLALYLGALVEAGQDPAAMTSLAGAVTVENARAALRIIYARQGERRTQHIAGIAGVALMIARHWLALPHQDCETLRRLARNLRPEHEGLAPRNEARLAQVNEPRRLDMVLALPNTLAGRVRRAGPPTVTLAQTFQTAVAIELFLMTGLRIANVTELEIGRTLLLRERGGIDILVPRESVKNRTPFTADLPWVSARLLREYLKVYRPLLGDAASPWLFPGARPGTHKSTGALRDQVTKAMAGVAGVAWHPHLFRHLLAHLELSENPGADALVTRALGHKRADTTRAHYSGFQTKSAIRQHDELVLRRRAGMQAGRKGRC
ncbi:tyrosine-type recombinase/integrase [Neoroseomonas oryzicola]|uniref:Tyrosine-type recombinase/integrase n=1 Tax=Neoroseomonas oryzicola TaxID=535904 RepID=A0A9X9WNM7_9PROT|nr:tyrosine-type recombinase/integrase [Neoroseomonas oryzicola]MBR0661937.1 tyrosine-type recombinase/integrase [Neoroseomonas oryzicola]NKE20203.1 tyrosine-type recombinase/integrase [Neoroseomonas oryzicola]